MLWHREHLPDPLPPDPLEIAALWLTEATQRAGQPNPNAMVLATADAQGVPSARVVLCKQIVPQPGYLTFYTNYLSHKGQDLTANPHAAIVMYWDALHRQVRIEGPVVRTSAAESDTYFASRNWQSRIGAWASQQSAPVASRIDLERAAQRMAQRFGTPSPTSTDDSAPDPGVPIDRPPHWGGYHLWIDVCELWVEGSARLHDRARWTRTLSFDSGVYRGSGWQSTRLQP
jgi:pyridoxamine 5'-phosphate oxidase